MGLLVLHISLSVHPCANTWKFENLRMDFN